MYYININKVGKACRRWLLFMSLLPDLELTKSVGYILYYDLYSSEMIRKLGTSKEFSIPLTWSTEPVKIPAYEPTPSFLETTAVKSVYIFQHALEQPNVKTPGPKAYAKPPQRPYIMASPIESSSDTFSSYQFGMNKSSPTTENSNGSFFFAKTPTSVNYRILMCSCTASSGRNHGQRG